MEIYIQGSCPSHLASENWFTGRVWQDQIIEAEEPARVRALRVIFEPGARTAWHTHPLGQTLHVVSGMGLAGLRGCSPRIIRSGDTVWIPPEEEHWHGAGPDTMMCHLAIQEALDGKVANWMEQVSDAEYSISPV